MELTREDIVDVIDMIEQDMSEYRTFAETWENMWKLKPWDSSGNGVDSTGKEIITTPTPFNVVNLAERLISSEPDIEVPPREVTVEEDKMRQKKQRWLKALWQRASNQSRTDIVADAWWTALVRGRGVLDVRWVANELPKRQRKNRIPILIRSLDPLECGFHYSPFGYVDYAYHRWDDTVLNVRAKYPKIDLDSLPALNRNRGRGRQGDRASEVKVTDFWHIDPNDGSVWNTVLVGDEIAIEPQKTKYYDIPMVEFMGEAYPMKDTAYKGLSILHPIKDLWPYESRLMSQVGTGLLWYFWPYITVQNEYGEEVGDYEVRPGMTQPVPWGTKVDFNQLQPNVPLAERMMQAVSAAIQHSTFPQVMYGEAPGDLQAGYGVSLLADAAKGRVKKPRRNLEMAMSSIGEIAFCLVEEFGDKKNGVPLWGYGSKENGEYSVTLMPDEIDGYYENSVKIAPNVPTEDLQRITLGIRLAESGKISDSTLRRDWINDVLPEDEAQRIVLEQAMKSEQLLPAVQIRTLETYFGENWKQVLGLEKIMAEQQEKMQQAMAMQQGGGPPQGGPPGLQPMPSALPGLDALPPGPGAPEIPGEGLPIQPESISGGMMPPQMEGQVSASDLGAPPDLPPEILQMIMNGMSPEEALSRMAGPPVNNGRT